MLDNHLNKKEVILIIIYVINFIISSILSISSLFFIIFVSFSSIFEGICYHVLVSELRSSFVYGRVVLVLSYGLYVACLPRCVLIGLLFIGLLLIISFSTRISCIC